MTCDLCLKRLPYPRDSNRLPGDGHTENDYEDEELHEKCTKLEFIASHVYWDLKKLFDEKKTDRRNIVTLSPD
jgi:hypothetical protein